MAENALLTEVSKEYKMPSKVESVVWIHHGPVLWAPVYMPEMSLITIQTAQNHQGFICTGTRQLRSRSQESSLKTIKKIISSEPTPVNVTAILVF